MSDLIKALQIFLKYDDRKYPTTCEHDTLIIVGIRPNQVSSEDILELEQLGFFISKEYDGFASFRFGSA